MAGVFTGMYSHSLDAKGRVIIPASYREKLGKGFTITINSSLDALVIYPADKWEAVYEQLVAVRDTDAMGMDYKRYLVANAQTDVDMDAQGRVLLPANLREEGGLIKDVTFVGMLDYVELWDTTALAEKKANTRASFAKHRRHMDETYATQQGNKS
ncbi:division/cell wall cluster transcriptional repressor MraZ [Eubacteriales bacterium OttesenSCG-928-A19]|nr:division/cell wall cluster transcriptional repressor MraZ [Eubacteriales bacterium OttesenSCG-928-A19]